MIGTTVAHYRIAAELGSGSMGVVYRAEDTLLERSVALKVLPPELSSDPAAKRRFLREARAASRLDHPNICTIHEIGETEDGRLFIVMAHYRGETLEARIARGQLEIGEACVIATQLARGLARAHAEDVVHRDVKPANVLLTAGGPADPGWVKILDFGLARVPGDAKLTQSGASLGTPSYMSPEQIRGEVDARCDVWSLGVVMFEMLAGRLPFTGSFTHEMIYSIFHRQPVPVAALRPDVPSWLALLIDRLLARDPAQRVTAARDVLAALAPAGDPLVTGGSAGVGSTDEDSTTWVTPPDSVRPYAPSASPVSPAPAPPFKSKRRLGAALGAAFAAARLASGGGWLWLTRDAERGAALDGVPPASPELPAMPAVAVLPFDDLAPDPGQDFFADGMTEIMITDLGKVSGLRVISRLSAMSYKGTVKAPPIIARELGVDYLLQGSVLRAEDQVRITTQLVDGALDEVLWSESYERPLQGILALQREVARAVAAQIEVRLTPREADALAAPAAVDPRALDLYLEGRQAWNERTVSSIRRGVERFERALEIEPSYALAHVGLAESYQVLGDLPFYAMPAREADGRAQAHAERALELDPTLGEAYAALALVDAHRYDWQGAEAKFKRAIELSPSYATAYQWYGERLLLQQRWDEALKAFWMAELLDPLSAIIKGQLGRLMIYRRRYQQAADYFSRLTVESPSFWLNYYGLATAHLELGKTQDALSAIERAVELSGGTSFARAVAAAIRAEAGDPAPAIAMIEELTAPGAERLPPTMIANLAVAAGDRERALSELERGLITGDPSLPFINTDPIFDPVRDEPRFREILRTIGLAAGD